MLKTVFFPKTSWRNQALLRKPFFFCELYGLLVNIKLDTCSLIKKNDIWFSLEVELWAVFTNQRASNSRNLWIDMIKNIHVTIQSFLVTDWLNLYIANTNRLFGAITSEIVILHPGQGAWTPSLRPTLYNCLVILPTTFFHQLRRVLPIMAYAGRLRPKGVPFPGFR